VGCGAWVWGGRFEGRVGVWWVRWGGLVRGLMGGEVGGGGAGAGV